MPTAKHRISLSPDDRTHASLTALAKRRGQPLASVSLDLLVRALELEEDVHFSRVADTRVAQNEVRVSHAQAWK